MSGIVPRRRPRSTMSTMHEQRARSPAFVPDAPGIARDRVDNEEAELTGIGAALIDSDQSLADGTP
jgi:hypothetical protein